MVLQGGCLCGAIRYQATDMPFDADHFYCVIDFLCKITTPLSLCRAVVNVSNGQHFAAKTTLRDQLALVNKQLAKH